jgi:hypothetical protein
MPAKFRQVTPYAGMDENLPSGGAGMIVALNGSNLVKLVDGAGLDVVCSDMTRSMVLLDEITDQHQMALANTVNPTAGPFRLFKVTAKSVPGMDKVAAEAFPKNNRKNAQAKLKVLVLRPREVTISLRPAQVYSAAAKGYVNFTKIPFDPNQLRDEMNSIWTPQANLIFKLGKADPAPLKVLTENSQGADIVDPATLNELVSLKDGNNFTAFFVRSAFEGSDRPLGVTDPKSGVALIGDNRTNNTLAHEAGHYLGSYGENGKYTGKFGHQGTDVDLLMRDGGAGRRIPYSLVPYFNRGYTAKP